MDVYHFFMYHNTLLISFLLTGIVIFLATKFLIFYAESVFVCSNISTDYKISYRWRVIKESQLKWIMKWNVFILRSNKRLLRTTTNHKDLWCLSCIYTLKYVIYMTVNFMKISFYKVLKRLKYNKKYLIWYRNNVMISMKIKRIVEFIHHHFYLYNPRIN